MVETRARAVKIPIIYHVSRLCCLRDGSFCDENLIALIFPHFLSELWSLKVKILWDTRRQNLWLSLSLKIDSSTPAFCLSGRGGIQKNDDDESQKHITQQYVVCDEMILLMCMINTVHLMRIHYYVQGWFHALLKRGWGGWSVKLAKRGEEMLAYSQITLS